MARHIFSLTPMFSLNPVFLRNRVLALSPASAAWGGRVVRRAGVRSWPVVGRKAASQPGRAARRIALTVLGLFLLLAVPVTRAQASAFTPEAHCADVASLVSRAGGAILETAPETFHRVVRDNSFCDPDGVARPAYAPTQDNPACFVGYKCSDYPVR